MLHFPAVRQVVTQGKLVVRQQVSYADRRSEKSEVDCAILKTLIISSRWHPEPGQLLADDVSDSGAALSVFSGSIDLDAALLRLHLSPDVLSYGVRATCVDPA